MRCELLIVVAMLSLVSAVIPFNDRILIAELKQISENTQKMLLQDGLKFYIEVSQSIVDAGVANPLKIHRLQRSISRAKNQLETLRVTEAILENFIEEFSQIIGDGQDNDDLVLERMNLYTKGAADKLQSDYSANSYKHFQLFIFFANPKIRQLSEATKQSEHELISAFNDFAYAGLLAHEQTFDKFIKTLNKY